MEIIATRVEFLDRAPREADADSQPPHEAPVAA
jgi:hypothetical protein